jgi:8-oxo-dGTP pyrophosphatase MutT (NUDIX family)
MAEIDRTKEKLIPIATAAALVFHEKDVLLVTSGVASGHITGTKGLPSGRVDEGETEAEAAARELFEETGLSTHEEDLSEFEGNFFQADIPRKDGTTKRYNWRVFEVKAYEGELRATEETIPEWVAIENIEQLDKEGKLLPNIKNAIDNALKGKIK